MISGAAGDHEYFVDLAQFLVAQSLFVEHDPAVHEMSQQGVGHRCGLLGYLLEHEVFVAALFGGGQVPVDVKFAELDIGVAIEIEDPVAVRGDHHCLVLAELDGMAGVFDERGHVRPNEHLAVADPEHQRCRPAGGHDGARLIGVREHQGEVALQPAQHRQHGSDEIACRLAVPVRLRHQMHGDLGVGIAGELHAGQLQLVAQSREVLDDAVVDDGDLAGGVAVRVRVAVGGATMGGPAGVAQPGVSGQRGRFHSG